MVDEAARLSAQKDILLKPKAASMAKSIEEQGEKILSGIDDAMVSIRSLYSPCVSLVGRQLEGWVHKEPLPNDLCSICRNVVSVEKYSLSVKNVECDLYHAIWFELKR